MRNGRAPRGGSGVTCAHARRSPFAHHQSLCLSMNEPEAVTTPPAKDDDWDSPGHVHALVLLLITSVGIYLCLWMSAPFVPAMAWALALAVLFAPLQRRLEQRYRHPGLAATGCVIAAGILIVVPALFVADRIAGEVAKWAGTVNLLVESGEWRRPLDAHSGVAAAVQWIDDQFDLPEVFKGGAMWMSGVARSFVQGTFMHLIGLILTFYMLFYFLRDRSTALQSLRGMSPLAAGDMNRVFVAVGETVHATVYGTFVVAIVQGTLGGLMFWWLGLPAPMLWGLVMGLLAVVPVLGAFVIWIPAAIFLFLIGAPGKALVLAIWGTVVIGGIDNVLYPLLVGSKLKIHTAIAFISIVGGLIVFGTAGLILGPVIFTATRVLLEIWRGRNAAAEA